MRLRTVGVRFFLENKSANASRQKSVPSQQSGQIIGYQYFFSTDDAVATPLKKNTLGNK